MIFKRLTAYIQMHNYKGNLRRQHQDVTPTKSSWEQTRQNPPPQRYEPRNDYRYEQKPEPRYESRAEIRNESRLDGKFEKSQLSYYQSQSSRVYYDYDHSERPSAKSQVAILDEKYFYNSVLPVTIKSFEREQHQIRLRIQIQAKIDKGQHLLNIYLTDDSNPKFLWMFSIKEIDFMNLKSEQKLKVSYAGFPEMLENCLRECEQNEGGQNRNNYLVLSIKKGGEGKLSFVESNRYKESTHLQFNFKLASDEQIKEYLSNKLLVANEEIDQNRTTIRNMEHTLSERMKQIQRKNSDLNSILAEREQMKEQFKLELNQKRTELETIKLNELTKTKKESDLELKELKQKLTSEIESLSKQKIEATNRYSEARERISLLQSNEREQTIKIMRLEQDFSKSSKQSDQLRAQNKSISQQRFQNEKNITELTCKIQSLRSELQDKKTIITSTVQLKQTNNNQISSLEQQTADQKKQIIRLDAKISELEGEVLKLTSNNSEYIEKISRQKEKLQERGEIIKDQEKELKELKKNEATLERENEKLQYQKQEKENKIKNLQDQLEKMQKKFEDQQAMVAYLQKNLNERPGLRTPNYYPPTNTYQSASYSGVNRQLPSQLSTNSNVGSSRVALTGNPRVEKPQKYEPNIKRYEDRSKSPIPTRFPQQKDPEQDEQSYNQRPTKFQKPQPVKFKMSQPKQSEK